MAAGRSEVSKTLKIALFETLNSILSPSDDIRTSAEQQINVLEVTDEFGVHLTELTLDTNAPLPIRQLSSVLLRQYVESHWSCDSDKFRPPETLPEAKAAIRSLLPVGLQEVVSKVRSSVAYAISAIAHWDWPETWPELFDLLMVNLKSENSYAVHGAMRALTEVSRDVSDAQMPQIAPIILPQMLIIFTDVQKYSIRTRGRAVEIFVTCLEVISAMADYNKSALKNMLLPILPQFTEALVKALLVPEGTHSDSGLKKDILKALKMLIRCVPKEMIPWLPHILSPVWSSLTESASLYVNTVVNVTEDENNPVDSDGEVLGFENLVFSIFDFVSGLVESPKFKNYVEKGMTDLLYYIILYMQITEEQVRMWGSDPDRFVEDEDDESFSYSVRISARDLLTLLGQDFEDQTAVSLCTAITKHIQETGKNPTNPHWWKIHEACMLAIGSLKELIISQIKNNNLQFDILGFLQTVILEDLNMSVSAFLLGRCLWTASCFTTIMTNDLIERFLQATISGLQVTQPTCVRVSAVRAVYEFCEHLKKTNRTDVLLPYLTPLAEGLLTLVIQFSNEVMSLVLDAICMVLTVDNNFTATIESRVCPLAIAVFLKHNSDPVIITIVEDIFKQLCKNPACHGPLQHRLLPTIVSILQAQPSKVPLGLQAVTLDVLQTLVRNSPKPLSDPLIQQAFPAAVYCIMHTDDNSILQNGSECMRSYVWVGLEQLIAWRDDQGCCGLDYVLNVADLILDPRTNESAAAFVGGLVSALLRKLGNNLGEKAEHLLRAVLSKMQQTQSFSVTQNFIMIFAQLCRTDMERMLEFLSCIPGPTGKSALEFILKEWCNCHAMYISSYENKVSAFALSKLLEYSIKSNDTRLQEIMVKGDIVNFNEAMRTRSKVAQNPDQWTNIPLLVKIYKTLIQELGNWYESYNQDEEHDTDDEIDENQENNSDEFYRLPAIGADFFDYDPEAEALELEPEIMDDPVYKMNFKTYLFEYLQKLQSLPCYPTFSQHHTAQEKQILGLFGLQQ